MRLLHIASHKGNVGDLVNHQGFYNSFFNHDTVIESVEIRDFYYSAKQRKYFDVNFAEYMNTFDLVVFGGGGFFDMRWENSATGTTIDFSKAFIDAISTKILVNAMGYHEYPDLTNKQMILKFNGFLESAIAKQWMLTVRNDGSYSRICQRYGQQIADRILKVPDNGFFVPYKNVHNKVKKSFPAVGMCITNDLFSASFNHSVKEDTFNAFMAEIIKKLCFMGIVVKLFPHTPADIGTISNLLSMIQDEFKREQITVAAYDASSAGAVSRLLAEYKACDCIVGMRFHSLVSGIRLGIPTIALAGHEQIQALFHELELDEYCIKVDNLSFADQLISFIEVALSNQEIIKNRYKMLYNKKIRLQKKAYRAAFCNFLSQ